MSKAKIGVCVTCNETKPVRFSRKLKENQCRNCYDFDFYHSKVNYEPCYLCGNFGRIALRNNGKPVCQNCYRARYQVKGVCEDCSKYCPTSLYRKIGKKLCSTCRSKYRMQDKSMFETCFICNQSGPVSTRDGFGKPVCYSCYSSYVGNRY